MKITVVANQCDLSEIASYLDLANRGHSIHVIHNPNWQSNGVFDNSPITTATLTVKHRLHLAAIHELKKQLLDNLPDLIYAPINKTLAISIAATKNLPIKVVGYRGTMGHLRHYDLGSRLTYLHPRLDGIVSLSKAVENYLLSMHVKATIITAYKGFDINWYKTDTPASLSEFGFDDDAFIIGFSGNVRPVKGIDILLQALAELPATSKIKLLLIGEIRCKRIQRMLADPAYSTRVTAPGFLKDAYRLIGACDAFVMPSIKREGLCRAVVEAMAQSVPPIVSDVGGMPELVEANISGLVVPPSDPTALAKALSIMEKDANRRLEMGKAAEQRIHDHFTVARTTDGMEKLFYKVLKR